MIKKYSFALSVYVLVFIGLAYVLSNTLYYGLGIVFASLLISNSVAVFAVSMYMSYRYGFDIIHTILMVLTYILSVYIVFNDSALIYLFLYLIMDLMGFGMGRLIRKSKKAN